VLFISKAFITYIQHNIWYCHHSKPNRPTQIIRKPIVLSCYLTSWQSSLMSLILSSLWVLTTLNHSNKVKTIPTDSRTLYKFNTLHQCWSFDIEHPSKTEFHRLISMKPMKRWVRTARMEVMVVHKKFFLPESLCL
jgi:hypothetical protein